jgi:hypothetical protein
VLTVFVVRVVASAMMVFHLDLLIVLLLVLVLEAVKTGDLAYLQNAHVQGTFSIIFKVELMIFLLYFKWLRWV